MEEEKIKEKVSEVLTLLSQLSTKDAKFILKQVEYNIDKNSKVVSADNVKLRLSVLD